MLCAKKQCAAEFAAICAQMRERECWRAASYEMLSWRAAAMPAFSREPRARFSRGALLLFVSPLLLRRHIAAATPFCHATPPLLRLLHAIAADYDSCHAMPITPFASHYAIRLRCRRLLRHVSSLFRYYFHLLIFHVFIDN
jgi:hypothetical protein